MTNEQIKLCAEYKMEVIAKKLVITVGYRKGICQELLTSKGKERDNQLKRLKEANQEIKKLLIL